jgi:hypothetical protein
MEKKVAEALKKVEEAKKNLDGAKDVYDEAYAKFLLAKTDYEKFVNEEKAREEAARKAEAEKTKRNEESKNTAPETTTVTTVTDFAPVYTVSVSEYNVPVNNYMSYGARNTAKSATVASDNKADTKAETTALTKLFILCQDNDIWENIVEGTYGNK